MSLFPFMEGQDESNEEEKKELREYGFDFEKQRLTGEIVYNEEALKVWIYHTLRTNRYMFSAYSWDYGQDVNELIGKVYEKGYIDSEIERRVKEAILINEDIKRVYDFDITFKDGQLAGNFKVESIYGEVVVNV